MLLAGQKANKKGIPVVLDPVGVGASSWRLKTALHMLEKIKFAVIRGNLAEIKALSGLPCQARGVDSIENLEENSSNNSGKNKGENSGESLGAEDENMKQNREIARLLARKNGCVVAVTGATDVVADSNKRYCYISNGHQLLSRVTGTGCMVTSLIGACCGATGDFLAAAATGIMMMNLAGGKAADDLKGSEGLGTFKVKLFDYLSILSPQDIIKGAKISGK
jgi:hydroxyethylthiazole kinase